jgi:hypothetical protein
MSLSLSTQTKETREPTKCTEESKKKQEVQAFARMTRFFDDLADEPALYEEYR